MRNDMYYGVQFAQSRFELEQNANPACLLQEAKSSCLQENKSTDRLRITNSASQYIEEGADESHAIGHWTTVSYEFDGAKPGDGIYLVIGKYTNEFCVKDHIWQLEKVSWEESYRCGPWKVSEDKNFENYLKKPSDWAPELPGLVSLEDMEASAKTIEILKLRNYITGELIYNLDIFKNTKSVLATSPVLKMADSLDEAEAFISVNMLAPYGENEVQSTRGSLSLVVCKENGKWIVKEQNWYNYISLEPWQLV